MICIIIGDSGVGKTSLISRFVENKFPTDYLPTIGTNLYIKTVTLSDSLSFKFTCWDIAGEKEWTTVRRMYYRGSSGALLTADVSRKETFVNLSEYWLKELRKNCGKIPVVILLNKIDLPSEIEEDEILKLQEEAASVGMFKTSAKTAENIKKAFHTLINSIISKE